MKSTDIVTLWCTLIPNPGKEDKLREALLQLADTVKKVETECMQYQVIEIDISNGEGPSSNIMFKLLEQWTNKIALENHTKREWLIEHRQMLDREKVLASDESIQPVAIIGGFGLRLSTPAT
ncbi:hypothetical protein B0J11DRAFT_541649 [Dendryphion nanum]|uniref:ABM domain-containing protein n=1 Tax=Dendryphion nanum TaxID=256645 RepID=A0A9P9D6C3_9PLEO|nr:hypothetical protein B0J11DRAFT_541649 [Dendryphion nanum]